MQLPREFDSDRINGTGSVDTALVENWIEVAAATDFATLADRVGPGPCTADFDGIDVRATFPWLDLTLTECKLAFDESDPFFEALVPLGRTAEKAAPWDLDRYVADNPLPTPIPPPPAPPTATEVADSTD